MIRAFLRRWLNQGTGPEHQEPGTETHLAALVRRVTELEESLEYLWLAHKKLRGRVTGGLRAAEVDAAADIEALPGRGNPQALELLAKRRGHAVSR